MSLPRLAPIPSAMIVPMLGPRCSDHVSNDPCLSLPRLVCFGHLGNARACRGLGCVASVSSARTVRTGLSHGIVVSVQPLPHFGRRGSGGAVLAAQPPDDDQVPRPGRAVVCARVLGISGKTPHNCCCCARPKSQRRSDSSSAVELLRFCDSRCATSFQTERTTF